MRLGRRAEALREARHAVEIDPLSMAAYNNLGVMYSYAGDPVRAKDAFDVAVALGPDAGGVISNLALTYSDLGRHADAIRTAERGDSLDSEDFFMIATLGYVYARAGMRTEAERALADLNGRDGASPYLIAGVHAGLGDVERAFELLERAVDERDDLVTDLGMDPVFNGLHGDPRMQRLLRRMGLT
jgi:Flp pilus assembly protein TadD